METFEKIILELSRRGWAIPTIIEIVNNCNKYYCNIGYYDANLEIQLLELEQQLQVSIIENATFYKWLQEQAITLPSPNKDLFKTVSDTTTK